MGGGSGVGPLADLAERLAAHPLAPQVVVVCGTNGRLRVVIEALPAARSGAITVLGFTHAVDVLLEACDVVVSKAGGLTCSEALVKRAPLVIFRPTPGQEVGNAEYLESGGAAVHADTLDMVEASVARWITDPEARERAREAAGRLAKPNAALDIARRVLAEIPAAARRARSQTQK